MKVYSTRTRALASTAGLALSLGLLPSMAQADCLPNTGNTVVTCQAADLDGFNASTFNNVSVLVVPGASVAGKLQVGATGAPGSLNNEGTINVGAGNTAIDAAGGVTINNAATGPGLITGNILMGATTGTQVNTFNNLGAGSTVTGNFTSGGATNFTNNGTFTGTVSLGAFTNNVTIGSTASQTGLVLNAAAAGTNTLTLAGTGANTLTMALAASTTVPAANIDVLAVNTTGTWSLTAPVALDSNVNIIAGTLSTPDADFFGNKPITNAGTLNFANTADGVYSGVISGTGAVTVGGAPSISTTTLSGANTYAGTTTVNNGTLRLLGGAAILDTANVTVNALGTLNVAASETINGLSGTGAVVLTSATTTLAVGSGSFSGTMSGAGNLNKVGTGTFTLGALPGHAGTTTVTAGTLAGTNATLPLAIINTGGTVNFDQAAGGTYSGVISGAGGLSKTGAGTLTLSGTNTFTGATSITGGTLVTGATNLSNTTALTVGTGATFRISANKTIGSLAGAGAVDAGAFTLTAGGDNTSTAYSGVATGTGLTKTGTGTMTMSGAGSTLGTITVNGGKLVLNGSNTGNLTVGTGATLGGSGTVVGTVTNGGTLAPGNSPGIFRVTGAYVQSAGGTLAMEILPGTPVAGTTYDQVAVTGTPGTATLAGNLALTLTPGAYTVGATYDVVKAANGITGSLALSGNVLSPFISLANTGIVTTTGTERVYRLTVARTNYATGIGAGASANQIAVATGFQDLVTGATGDAATAVTGVDNMTLAQALTFFDQASPEGYGAYAVALQDQGELFTRQVSLRQQEARQGSALWIRGYGSWSKAKNDGFRFGSDIDVKTGFAGGFDWSNGTYTLGGAVGYSNADVDFRMGNASGDSKSWQAGVYGNYNAGPIRGELQLTYVSSDVDAARSITAGTISRSYTADTDGKSWRAKGTIGYDFGSQGMILRPFVGIDYVSGKIDGFTESGGNATTLTVHGIDADQTALLAGVDLAGTWGGFSPYARLTYRHLTNSKDTAVTAMFNSNSATTFTVNGVGASQSQFDADAGLNYGLASSVAVFVGYQGSFRDNFHRHGVSGGLRVGF